MVVVVLGGVYEGFDGGHWMLSRRVGLGIMMGNDLGFDMMRMTLRFSFMMEKGL